MPTASSLDRIGVGIHTAAAGCQAGSAGEGINRARAGATLATPQIDFASLRQQVTMEQILRQLGLFDGLRGRGLQRRGLCPIHGQPTYKPGTFSAHLGKNIFQCFKADCAAQGNVLDLWAAGYHLPIYEAALHLAETFQFPRNRKEEPVRTRQLQRPIASDAIHPVTLLGRTKTDRTPGSIF